VLLTLLAAAAALAPYAVAHQGHDHGAAAPEPPDTQRPWRIDMAVHSDSAAARQHFMEGMMLLHLFEYRYARRAFQRARADDPDLVMAYWGEAMAHNRPIWDEQNAAAARAVLEALAPDPAARQARAGTPRERDYLAAVDVLYGAGSKSERDRAYLQHMRAMASRYPEDHEVALFHALAIFGTTAGVRDHRRYMDSGAISLEVFLENPRHPGAAHYFIHAVDDPVHAPLGLEAARRLAETAPAAGHAQHMTSHIFVALGMWPEVVAANEAAVAAVNRMRAGRGAGPRHWGHYHNWLFYGLLQLDDRERAEALLRSTRRQAGPGGGDGPGDPLEISPDRSELGSLVYLWSRYLLETGHWDSPVADWTFTFDAALDPRLTHAFVRTLQHLHRHDPDRAGQHRQRFTTLARQLEARVRAQPDPAPTELQYLDRLAVMELLLAASTAWHTGDCPGALELARRASAREGDMPHAFGPPFVDLPPAEMLGELLLEAERYDAAAAAFQRQLERSHHKPRALRGLARAERERGNPDRAEFAMQQYRDIHNNAEPR